MDKQFLLIYHGGLAQSFSCDFSRLVDVCSPDHLVIRLVSKYRPDSTHCIHCKKTQAALFRWLRLAELSKDHCDALADVDYSSPVP